MYNRFLHSYRFDVNGIFKRQNNGLYDMGNNGVNFNK